MIINCLYISLAQSSLSCCADQKIALLGAMQSLFEGSMYTFVFLWTPALSPAGEHLPHGMIFACFMVGTSLVTLLVLFLTCPQGRRPLLLTTCRKHASGTQCAVQELDP